MGGRPAASQELTLPPEFPLQWLAAPGRRAVLFAVLVVLPSFANANCPEWTAPQASDHIAELTSHLRRWERAYRTDGSSPVSDEVFDQTERRWRELQHCFPELEVADFREGVSTGTSSTLWKRHPVALTPGFARRRKLPRCSVGLRQQVRARRRR